MFEHIMLDLETLDNTPTAAIVALGAVRFDIEKASLGTEFYEVIRGSSCQKAGMTIGADTVYWWMSQSPAARKIFSEETPKADIAPTLVNFSGYVKDIKNSCVWGNGSTFDNIILRNAYTCCILPVPWSYTRDFCFRTMIKNFPAERVQSGVVHNALEDARAQALTLIKLMRRIKGLL